MASSTSNNSTDAKDIPQRTGETTQPSSEPSPSEMKWKYGIDLSKASKDDITSFIQYRTHTYKQKGWTRSNLSTIYAEDFENFTRKEFEQSSSDARAELREVLRAHGVFLRIGRGYPISKELADLIQSEKPWPEDDPQRPSNVSLTKPQDAAEPPFKNISQTKLEVPLRPKAEDKMSSRETYEEFNKLGKQKIGLSDNP